MDLKQLNANVTGHKRAKRLGRGRGSGHGKTSGRGHGGQRSRAGGSLHPLFEGGQMPLSRRTPTRGFTNRWRKKYVVINVHALNRFEDGTTVDRDILLDAGLVSGKFDGVKVLGMGTLAKKLVVKLDRFSKTATAKIEEAGGQAIQA